MKPTVLRAEVLVIGSGAGGAVTAAMLAERGRDLILLEEGPWIDPDSYEPFSLDEMTNKYRHAGLNVALGSPPIAYVEGRCVGGGTEVNSGLYHRPPADLLEVWAREGVLDCTQSVLAKYAEHLERTLSVSAHPGPVPTASAVLERGAAKLGWQAVEVSRVFRYGAGGSPHRGVKQTMTRTLLPLAASAGARVIPQCRAERLLLRGRRVVGVSARIGRPDGTREPVRVVADHVFVCGGAIQTPALLQRSGIHRNIGRGLKVHPTAKLAARFPFAIDDHSDVPMHQVKEFAPDLTFGGSASRRGQVALALADSWSHNAGRMAEWENIAVYYASIRSDGSGRVRVLPALPGPIVSYRLTEADLSRLARGLVHLGELLFAADAVELFPSITGAPPLGRPGDLAGLWDMASRSRLNLMTIHLFSSVRMGQDRERTGTDSYGRVWGFDNLRVNDASLLPDAPGVNPQGTIMAFAARNCDHFLAGS